MRRPRLALWAILAWLVIWQVTAMALDSELLLPAPLTVIARTAELALTAPFWQRVTFSLARIFAGFALGTTVGIAAAALAVRFRRAEEFFAPAITVMKSVPVASITVLALVWLRAANLAVFVVMLVATPVMYENVAAGLRAQDTRLVEMATLFRIPTLRRVRLIVLPALMPHLQSGLALSLSMAWKAGVAAEVIGIPTGSFGEAIYAAKVAFDTPALFAWTLAVVALSVASERVLLFAIDALKPWLIAAAGSTSEQRAVQAEAMPQEGHAFATANDASLSSDQTLRLSQITWGAKDAAPTDGATDTPPEPAGCTALIDGFSLSLRQGEVACIMAPSGAGKTTLLRLVAGLERADAGHVDVPAPVSMVFQEDRLAEQASLLTNVRSPLTRGSAAWEEAPHMLAALGLESRMLAPAHTCSGGERKRCALARALLAPHATLLLDEPFTGLDETAHALAAHLVAKHEQDRIVLVATHDPADLHLLGARGINLEH